MGASAGEMRRISRWLCPHCSSRSCAHPKWADDKRDPQYGHAMCWLECGHLASGNRKLFEKTGRTHMRCLICVPGHWDVHVNEVVLMRKAQKRVFRGKRVSAEAKVSIFGG